MFAIVKFKHDTMPTVMAVTNSGYIYKLSTMSQIEWVASAYVSSDGKVIATTDDKVKRDGMFRDTIIEPYVPGDPDPLERFRSQPKPVAQQPC